MNKMERGFPAKGEAVLEYLDGEFRVVTAGSFVNCAVTGAHIPIESLRYWSVDFQEPYASAAIALARFREAGKTP